MHLLFAANLGSDHILTLKQILNSVLCGIKQSLKQLQLDW